MNTSNIASQKDAASSSPLNLQEDTSSASETSVKPSNGFTDLGLAAELIQAVESLGYVSPTQVQMRTIPLALASAENLTNNEAKQRYMDLMVSSQTGSGKTASFLLPVLHTLIHLQKVAKEQEKAAFDRKEQEALTQGLPTPKRPKRKNPINRRFEPAVPGALVLCPTRELALQVARDAIDLLRYCRNVRVANIIGGMPYAKQIAQLQNANLVVATPGRLLDLQNNGQIKLEKVQFLVVDEADRMLDLGFSEDLEAVHQLTVQRKQTMMFSATFAPRIQQLGMRIMHDSGAHVQRIEIASAQQKHENITQKLYWADNSEHKRNLLDNWLRDPEIDQSIVFASTQIECDDLAADLQQAGFSAVALHGALSQGLRSRRLSALRAGNVQILVATDVAARGIDVPTISHVFNYGLPMKAEDYTHRIGRTGRAGRSGLAITFAEFRDRRRIFDIENFTRQKLDVAELPGLEPKQNFPLWRNSKGSKGTGRSGAGRSSAGRIGSGARRTGSSFSGHKDSRFAAQDNKQRERFNSEFGGANKEKASRDRSRFGDNAHSTGFTHERRSAAERGFNVHGHGNSAKKRNDKPAFAGRRDGQFSKPRKTAKHY